MVRACKTEFVKKDYTKSIYQSMKTLTISILFLIILTGNKIISQEHWETAVYSYDQWRYFVGESEPLSSWKDIEFNDSNWDIGAGSIGYGDEGKNLKKLVHELHLENIVIFMDNINPDLKSALIKKSHNLLFKEY